MKLQRRGNTYVSVVSTLVQMMNGELRVNCRFGDDWETQANKRDEKMKKVKACDSVSKLVSVCVCVFIDEGE